LLPTGVPVWMYSSRVLTSISRCLTLIVMSKILSRCAFASVFGVPRTQILRAAKNASCGISTLPTCFMRRLPAF
jgi:hypothetical protein